MILYTTSKSVEQLLILSQHNIHEQLFQSPMKHYRSYDFRNHTATALQQLCYKHLFDNLDRIIIGQMQLS